MTDKKKETVADYQPVQDHPDAATSTKDFVNKRKARVTKDEDGDEETSAPAKPKPSGSKGKTA